MGIVGAALELLRPASVPVITDLARFSSAPVAVPSAATAARLAAGDDLTPEAVLALRLRAEAITRQEAMRIPAVRRAVHVIAGTISTFALAAWRGDVRQPDGTIPWLAQPDPARTLQTSLRRLYEDLIWHDRGYWLATREAVRLLPDGTIRVAPAGSAAEVQYLTRVDPRRVSYATTLDPDALPGLLIDGRPVDRRTLIEFDGAGLGGLERFGAALLDLYMDLQEAAGRYARAPHPKAILRNTGDDLDPGEIEALLAAWELARDVRSVGYMNDALEYQTFGWNSAELQLVEAREHAALEVARLFALPARALNAPSNDSMTYSNDVAARRDLLEAIRPWLSVAEQTLSMNDRYGTTGGILTPRGIQVRFYVEAYVRDDPTTRMQTWATALQNQILTLEEVRRQEPLAWTA